MEQIKHSTLARLEHLHCQDNLLLNCYRTSFSQLEIFKTNGKSIYVKGKKWIQLLTTLILNFLRVGITDLTIMREQF